MMVGVLTACSSTPTTSSSSSSRYKLDNDRPPEEAVDVSSVAEPEPQFEPPSRGGNKSPYRVLGKSYHVLPTAVGFSEEGIASWYGSKFHGYHTSNGEIYDMYKFTAAHKHLPLPSYVRVTNLDNGRQVIVRVNDRGPFHDERIIDLSYAAASRLGVLQTGTARVRLENVMPSDPSLPPTSLATAAPATVTPSAAQTSAPMPMAVSAPIATASPAPAAATPVAGYYLQVGAYASELSAVKVQNEVSNLVDSPVVLETRASSGTPVHRVRVGPFANPLEARRILGILQRSRFPDTLLIPPG